MIRLSCPGCLSVYDVPQFQGIEVQGVGVSTTKPNQARITFQVITEGKKANEAIHQNGESMQRVLMALRKAGIKDDDMLTAGLRCSPKWKQGGKGKPPAIGGYTASNHLTVRVRKLDDFGNIIDAASESGALIQGFQYEADSAEAEKQAMQAALRQCKDKATLMAQTEGVELGTIMSLQQQVERPEPIRTRGAVQRSAMPESGYGGIAAGDMDVTVTIVAVYAIGNKLSSGAPSSASSR